MFTNYFKVALRNMLRTKVYSAINVFGLSLGVASCLLLALYIQDELSYDRFNKNADHIARIIFNANINGGKISESVVMAPVAATLKKDFPEVKDAARLVRAGARKLIMPIKFLKMMNWL
jgi:putative ABC transport system permease protein